MVIVGGKLNFLEFAYHFGFMDVNGTFQLTNLVTMFVKHMGKPEQGWHQKAQAQGYRTSRNNNFWKKSAHITNLIRAWGFIMLTKT